MKPFALLITLCLCAGCTSTGRQPMIQSAGITPDHLHPGNRAVITAEIKDPFNIVDRVEGEVLEDPTLEFVLKDDGIAPDAKADDGIWTIEVKVPFNAPPGDFRFIVTAYDDAGQPIVVRNELGEVMPLTANFSLRIDIAPQS